MNTVFLPGKESWTDLCQRPGLGKAYLESAVRDILYRVKTEKDEALRYYARKFDGFCPDEIMVSENEIADSADKVSQKLKDSIKKAKINIEKFHSSQLCPEQPVETTPGILCWRKNVPIDKVGLYIPGGSAPLFSTLLMLGIPAIIAGCREIIICTPAGMDGTVNPAILYTANLLGLRKIFKAGGAQAIAAMAYGTETVPTVYKIFGPGNRYVTKAKQILQEEGIAIDMPAGPSEVLVIADKTADSRFIAADLISQAEHGPDSQAIFLTTDKKLLGTVESEIERQAALLPRNEIITKSLENSKLILLPSLDDCISFSNMYAPEHLILNIADPGGTTEKITNAGSVFLGQYSCESLGDYASGTNHTLPTNGYARSYSGVSVESFVKKITFQEVSARGMADLGPAVEIMAEAESLEGHRNAVTVRLKALKND